MSSPPDPKQTALIAKNVRRQAEEILRTMPHDSYADIARRRADLLDELQWWRRRKRRLREVMEEA